VIIDRTADVTPNRFESPWLRRTIGKRIGRADRDDMLCALLWVSEIDVVSDVASQWSELHKEVDRELREAERRRDRLSWQRSDQVAEGCHDVAKALADELWVERKHAADALKECETITDEFRWRLGVSLTAAEEVTDARAAVGVLNDQLCSARCRLAELMASDRKSLHRLARLEERKRQRSAMTPPATTIEQLDMMEQSEFDDAVRNALEHEGFRVLVREPRVLEVNGPGNLHGLVFCANVQRPARDTETDVRMFLAAQRQARATGIDNLMIATNVRYVSRPALRLLDASDIRLVQRSQLQRWIEWGLPLLNGKAAK
jgi:hypothetical protein